MQPLVHVTFAGEVPMHLCMVLAPSQVQYCAPPYADPEQAHVASETMQASSFPRPAEKHPSAPHFSSLGVVPVHRKRLLPLQVQYCAPP